MHVLVLVRMRRILANPNSRLPRNLGTARLSIVGRCYRAEGQDIAEVHRTPVSPIVLGRLQPSQAKLSRSEESVSSRAPEPIRVFSPLGPCTLARLCAGDRVVYRDCGNFKTLEPNFDAFSGAGPKGKVGRPGWASEAARQARRVAPKDLRLRLGVEQIKGRWPTLGR